MLAQAVVARVTVMEAREATPVKNLKGSLSPSSLRCFPGSFLGHLRCRVAFRDKATGLARPVVASHAAAAAPVVTHRRLLQAAGKSSARLPRQKSYS